MLFFFRSRKRKSLLTKVNVMTKIGTPFSSTSTKALLCGAGELGKEIAIELQRLGVEVIAVDSYPNAPAMQVAHRSYVLSMLDGKELKRIIQKEQVDIVIPEVEAIATEALLEMEGEGYRIIPTAKATAMTMNRENIRKLASEKLFLKTSSYCFASNKEELIESIKKIGMPCFVKPLMSSSGKGQSIVRSPLDIDFAWSHAQSAGRAGKGKVIVEGFIDFDYEITLLTVRHCDGKGNTVTSFCEAIGHRQEEGDYRESWQPHPMSVKALEKSHEVAKAITDELGGWGVFGVELFIKGDDVYFSEVSPRPHDTGMVTIISQNLSEFSLHARAVLGLPIPKICQLGPAASSVVFVEGESDKLIYENLSQALLLPNTQLRLFGKPEVKGKRRMGLALALGDSIEDAREKANGTSSKVLVTL